MYTLQTILEKLRQHKPELQRKYRISRLGVFGSYARGEATIDSDIDIAVKITDGSEFYCHGRRIGRHVWNKNKRNICPLFKKILCMPDKFHMFFWLDPKEPKSQERKDIQHFSFIRLD